MDSYYAELLGIPSGCLTVFVVALLQWTCTAVDL